MSAQLTFARPWSYFHNYSGCGQCVLMNKTCTFFYIFFMQTSSIMFFFSGWREGALFLYLRHVNDNILCLKLLLDGRFHTSPLYNPTTKQGSSFP